MTTITRVGYCKKCAEIGRPKTDHPFLVFGSKKGWHIRFAKRNSYDGMTPHLYVLIKKIGNNVVYKERCAMHDCTIEVYWDVEQHRNDWTLFRGMWVRGMMSLASWNSLCAFKDTGFGI